MKLVIICSLAILFVSSIDCRSLDNPKPPLSIGFGPLFDTKATTWDSFVFAQQWPATVCSASGQSSCRFPTEANYWTVHGLWPSQGSTSPSNCDTTQTFDQNTLKSIQSKMEQQWPNVLGSATHYSFWKYEWTKHGTCATTLAATSTALKYFQKGLDLNVKYNLKTILTNASIVPGKSYAVTSFSNVVKNVVGATPLIRCASSGTARIQEIRICFNTSFQPVNCSGSTNCQSTILYEAL